MKTTTAVLTLLLPLLVVAALGVTADAAPPLTFDDPTVTTEDWFGHAVALDGNYVLIGARHDDTHGTDVGQAHLFDATTGSLLQTFNDPTPTTADKFGDSVALHGNNVLIGAFRDDTNGADVGQAHLFDALTGIVLKTFDDPTPTTGDWFGNSVALDGNNVLIGAPGDNTSGNTVGQAHLFDGNPLSPTFGNLLQTFDDPTPSVGSILGDLFGLSLALDGNNVLIGARRDDTHGTDVGQAHLFDALTGIVLKTFDDPTPTTEDQFGNSVALDGNNVLIGAFGDDTHGTDVGQAHLFDAVTGDLVRSFDDPTVTDSDLFGGSVALDGNNVLIAAHGDATNGAFVGQAHLFDTTTGNLLRTFNDPTVTTLDFFGVPAALDGDHVLLGAQGDDTNGTDVGQAHLFTLTFPGDANGDGKVDGVDYIFWAINFGDDPADDPPGSPGNGDFNHDGVVDGVDYVTWAINFGQGPNDATAVPEPGSCALAVLACAGFLMRRRR